MCDDDKVGDDVVYSNASKSELKEVYDDDKVDYHVDYSKAFNQSLKSCMITTKYR